MNNFQSPNELENLKVQMKILKVQNILSPNDLEKFQSPDDLEKLQSPNRVRPKSENFKIFSKFQSTNASYKNF